VAGLVTAIFAGMTETVLGRDDAAPPAPRLSCGCEAPPIPDDATVREKLTAGFSFAFGPLFRDLIPWLLLGVLAAAAIEAFVPEGAVEHVLGGGLGSMVAMFLLGIPLYMCATASTPIAAALILKGLSPGAALVFLLSGPATNAASLVALSRALGLRTILRYLASIAVGTIAMGTLLDAVYRVLGLHAAATVGHATETLPPWAESACLAGLIVAAALAFRAQPSAHDAHPGEPDADGCCPPSGG
jgi:uncharacterized membrane protein YraQ (UPF0718 family)